MYELLFSTNKTAMDAFEREKGYSHIHRRQIMIQDPLSCQRDRNGDLVFRNIAGRRLIIHPVSESIEGGMYVVSSEQYTYIFSMPF